mgnify:CR=1 FL=1
MINRHKYKNFSALCGFYHLKCLTRQIVGESYVKEKVLNSLNIKNLGLLCGEGGIRTPGTFQFNSFQDCRNRPLYHLSFPRKGLQNYINYFILQN